MRQMTKATVGLLSLGVIAGAFQYGSSEFLIAKALANDSGLDQTPPTTSPETGPAQAPSKSAQPLAVAAPKASTTGASSSGASKSGTAADTQPSSTPTVSKATPTQSETVATSGSQIGDAIRYKYGTIQLEVVKSGSGISAINLVQASTKGREYASAPDALVQLAMSAQGASFGNLSGATYTTEAFRAALESALAKF